MFLPCLTLALLGLILIPPAAALVRWQFDRDARRFPLACVGASLMLFSFLILPWLSFEPLRVLGLDWLSRLIPFAGPLIEWLDEGRRFNALAAFLGPFNFITRPRGWLALLLSGNLPIGVLTLFLAGMAFVLAQVVTWLGPRKLPSVALITTAGLSLALLLFNLPTIDGLGENDFPNALTVALPFLGAHLNPAGPTVMVVGLTLLIVGGALALSGAGRRDEHEQDE